MPVFGCECSTTRCCLSEGSGSKRGLPFTPPVSYRLGPTDEVLPDPVSRENTDRCGAGQVEGAGGGLQQVNEAGRKMQQQSLAALPPFLPFPGSRPVTPGPAAHLRALDCSSMPLCSCSQSCRLLGGARCRQRHASSGVGEEINHRGRKDNGRFQRRRWLSRGGSCQALAGQGGVGV